VQTPDVSERLSHGGVIGYLIIGIGLIAFLFGAVRFVQLTITGLKVSKQRENLAQPTADNPLGRILRLYQASTQIDAKSLEHRLEEAVLKETAKLESFLWAVRIVQVVAPLMGLLGTVTGMIKTFQSITLFGTGDPKRMAGGISEALVTTMLGLIVAISLVFLHSWLRSLSRRVSDVLEQQSAGLVAQQSEKEEQNAGLAPAAV
jgi:biopolymer transport protein ExbB